MIRKSAGSEPLISVIVSIYNVEAYLQKCIETIRNQTYANLEILLIDDGSTDTSSEICDKATKVDSRIRVVHKKNGGLSDARNAGISIAKGRYLAFVDGDDYLHKNFIKVLLDNAQKYNADISVCNYYKVPEHTRSIRQDKRMNFTTLSNVEAMRDILLPNSLCDVMTWNKLYKRELFTEHGIEFPFGKIHEDNFTTYKLLYYSDKVVFTGRPLYYYLQRTSSITGGSYSEKSLQIVEACDEMIQWINDRQLPLREEALAFRLWATLYLISKKNTTSIVSGRDWQQLSRWIATNKRELLFENKFIDISQKLIVCTVLLGKAPYAALRWSTYKVKELLALFGIRQPRENVFRKTEL